MAITTLAQVRSGLQPPVRVAKANAGAGLNHTWLSYWGLGGNPSAGAFDTTLNGVALTAPQAGQMAFLDPPSGAAYLARLANAGARASTGVPAVLLLVDRLWHNGGYTITSTSAQNSTTPTWPARDEDGATAGKGVLLALMLSAAAGAAAPTITVSYTNSGGTSGRTATNIVPTSNSPPAGNVYILGLDTGDVGVKSVESLTLSTSWLSGTMNLIAFRPVAFVQADSYGRPCVIDAITGAMPRMFNGSVLEPWWFQQGVVVTSPTCEATYALG